MDWFKIGKGVHQGCTLSLCLFNLYAEYIVRNARLREAQTRIQIARQWQPTPVFLPGESQGRGNLAGCRLWGRAESDTPGVT